QNIDIVHPQNKVNRNIRAVYLADNAASTLLNRFREVANFGGGGAKQSVETLSECGVERPQVGKNPRMVERRTKGPLDLSDFLHDSGFQEHSKIANSFYLGSEQIEIRQALQVFSGKR